jgi:trans-aconitate 2-methyltransferase
MTAPAETGQAGPPESGWDARLYAANTAHHRRYDDDTLRGVRLRPEDWVVDLGCGVGDFTARLAGLVPAGQVLGVDAEADMVAAARHRLTAPHVRLEVCRAQELSRFAAAGRYDAVLSVAMLHWIAAAEHPGVLGQVRRALRPGGVFRAEFGGHGQIAPVRRVLDEVSAAHGGGPADWYFPTVTDYQRLLAGAGFVAGADGWVDLIVQRREFPDSTAFLGWLRSQIFVGYDRVLPPAARPAFRAAAEERALTELQDPDGRYDLDYVRLDLLAYAA